VAVRGPRIPGISGAFRGYDTIPPTWTRTKAGAEGEWQRKAYELPLITMIPARPAGWLARFALRLPCRMLPSMSPPANRWAGWYVCQSQREDEILTLEEAAIAAPVYPDSGCFHSRPLQVEGLLPNLCLNLREKWNWFKKPVWFAISAMQNPV
jgi:hypothetical protein